MEKDPRALTLLGVLRLGFLGRCAVMLLECVEKASSCQWVQAVLRAFAQITGYHVMQGVLLHLHKVWLARRSRWWCVLTHFTIGAIPWEPFPQRTPVPLVAHLLDSFKPCTDEELHQLELDLYEFRQFAQVGFEANEVQWSGQMSTSLHSIANQFIACPCGCRSNHILFLMPDSAKGGCIVC